MNSDWFWTVYKMVQFIVALGSSIGEFLFFFLLSVRFFAEIWTCNQACNACNGNNLTGFMQQNNFHFFINFCYILPVEQSMHCCHIEPQINQINKTWQSFVCDTDGDFYFCILLLQNWKQHGNCMCLNVKSKQIRNMNVYLIRFWDKSPPVSVSLSFLKSYQPDINLLTFPIHSDTEKQKRFIKILALD